MAFDPMMLASFMLGSICQANQALKLCQVAEVAGLYQKEVATDMWPVCLIYRIPHQSGNKHVVKDPLNG